MWRLKMSDQFPDISSFNLTPQELNKVQYHRANLFNPGRDEEGRPVTIYSTGIQIPEGKYKGLFVSVPGYFDGKIVEDEDILWDKWKKDIEKGFWPIYNSSEELNKRDQYVHQIMDLYVDNMMRKLQMMSPNGQIESLDYKDSPLK